MFDVFYINKPTGLFAQERQAVSIEDARTQSRTRYLWIVDGHNDYSKFDWFWEPPPWEAHQAHVWPSQHQENGGTWFLPKHAYQDVNRHHEPIQRLTGVPRLHIKHKADSVDAGDKNSRYICDYLSTLKRLFSNVDWTYCWVTADICDYTDFDFTWHPSEWQQEMLHVFASNEQKFGDTFYVHVPSFLAKTQNLKLLEWYDTINFLTSPSVKREPPAGVWYQNDSMVDAVWECDFKDPVVQFFHDWESFDQQPPTISLWREKTKTVTPLTFDHSTAVVPRECKNYLKTQIYDYSHIDKTHRKSNGQQQDIVFISYDEPEAELNWQKLKTRFPQSKRVHGVQGMENALQAAAQESNTPWYFAVFAKTQLHDEFDFFFRPDYFQQAKHYVFYCENPVNGLTYGHMGIIMYNTDMVLKSPGYDMLGLDWTLSFPHEIVPKVSCIGNFATTPYHTWRTAFREVAKLCYYNKIDPSVDSDYRIQTWCNRAQGEFAEWCVRGARDGVKFFDECDGELDKLKNSFRWQWLRQRFVDTWGEHD